MRQLDHVKLGLGAVGLLIWAYGARIENSTIRWIGIAVFALAFLARFYPGHRRREHD